MNLSSIVSAGGSLVSQLGSAVLGYLGTAATNRANKQINESNLDWQTNENELSRQFAQDMWNANNQYNSPTAQKQRLLDAKMNPWLANSEVGVGSGSAGAVSPSGVGSAPSSIPMVQPQVPDLSQTIPALISAENSKSQRFDAIAKIYDVMARRDPSAANRWLNQQVGNLGLSESVAEDYVRSQTSLSDSQSAYYGAVAEVQRVYGRDEAKAKIENLNALSAQALQKLDNLRSEKRLTDANIRMVAEQVATEFVRRENIRADTNRTVAETERYNASLGLFLDGMRYDNSIKLHQSGMAAFEESQMRSDWISNRDVRKFRESERGSGLLQWNYMNTPEGNPYQSFVEHFMKAISPFKLTFPK